MSNDYDDYDIDNAWDDFCKEGNIDDTNLFNRKDDSEIKMPKCTEIYISTKTKIAFLTNSIDLNSIFWNINVMPYHLPNEGVVKKQMKINFLNSEEVNDMTEKIVNEKNVDVQIISRIVNPNGRIKFRDIRKISIGLSQKDILSYRSKKKSAFYNCFVLILRIKHYDTFKEIHIKVFNTGKLEIPGIRDDDVLIKSLDVLVDIIKKYSDDKQITYDLTKSETVLINSNFNCGFYLNRDKLLDILKYKYKVDCVYDACQYPGIQCKYTCNNNEIIYKLSFMIFRTGSILIVGKCDEDVLYQVYNYIKDILYREYSEIYISNNDTEKSNIKTCDKKHKKRIIYVS